MKPTKNRIYCKDCGRTKMLFETEKKADTFIKFNQEDIEAQSGYSPQRSYFCFLCGGWHVTSSSGESSASRNEELFEEYLREKANNKARKKNKAEPAVKARVLQKLEEQLAAMNDTEKEQYFEEALTTLEEELNHLMQSNFEGKKAELNLLRFKQTQLFTFKNQHFRLKKKKQQEDENQALPD